MDKQNPFDVLREERELGHPKGLEGEEAQAWVLLSWVGRHTEGLFGWPGKPALDFSEEEVQLLKGPLLENALLALSTTRKKDLTQAHSSGGVWLGLFGEERREELENEKPSFSVSRDQLEARHRFLNHLLSVLKKGDDPEIRKAIDDIYVRWDGKLKSWLRKCLLRGEVEKLWGRLSSVEQRSFHGRFSIEALSWILHEIDGLEDFEILLPERLRADYDRALAKMKEPWPEGKEAEVEVLVQNLLGRELETDGHGALSKKAVKLYDTLQGLNPQPSSAEVLDVLQDLEDLQESHVSGRLAIQACTACHLWVHRLEQEGKFYFWKDGSRVHRWQIQLLLLHHFNLNGSSDRAKVVYDEIEKNLPSEKRRFIQKILG